MYLAALVTACVIGCVNASENAYVNIGINAFVLLNKCVILSGYRNRFMMTEKLLNKCW